MYLSAVYLKRTIGEKSQKVDKKIHLPGKSIRTGFPGQFYPANLIGRFADMQKKVFNTFPTNFSSFVLDCKN